VIFWGYRVRDEDWNRSRPRSREKDEGGGMRDEPERKEEVETEEKDEGGGMK
jgi:hypothetical protein